MSNLNHLAEVISTEAELTEQLAEVMKVQRLALVNCDAVGVECTTDKQQELLMPIEGLENERARLTREIWSTVTSRAVTDGLPIGLSELISHLDGDEARRLSAAGTRLNRAVESLMKLNQANQYLIEQSRKFVRETFRIVSNGYSRQLVDHKI